MRTATRPCEAQIKVRMTHKESATHTHLELLAKPCRGLLGHGLAVSQCWEVLELLTQLLKLRVLALQGSLPLDAELDELGLLLVEPVCVVQMRCRDRQQISKCRS